MKKLIALALLSSVYSLSGCVGIYENPLTKMNNQELSTLTVPQLCHFLNKKYKTSQNGIKEAYKRGLTDCSYEEVYCANMGLQPKSPAYYQCRLQIREQLIQQSAIQSQAYEAAMTRQTIQQAINRPQYVPFNPTPIGRSSINCTSQVIGNTVYTNC